MRSKRVLREPTSCIATDFYGETKIEHTQRGTETREKNGHEARTGNRRKKVKDNYFQNECCFCLQINIYLMQKSTEK